MRKNYLGILQRISACIILFLSVTIAFGQQSRTITGKVTDARNGTGIASANIVVNGTTIGATTLQDGTFSISVPQGARSLTISSIGFATQDLTLTNSNNLTVVLDFGTKSLDEVVVVGYGTQRRKEVTSAVASVKAEDFNQGGARNALDLIQGKVAGLAITRTGSSNPNSGVAIQLRGVTSLVGDRSPLIVIDGIPGGNLDLLQQDDIESFDVLKDGSAAAIYGTRANGGVILVTTKKGKAGPARFDYSTYFRKEYITRRPDFLTAAEYREKVVSQARYAQYGIGDYAYNSDFFDDIVNHDNLSQYHNLALSGGSSNTSYRGSIFYNDFQGIGKENNRRQYGTRLSLNHRGLNDRLVAQVNVVNNFNRANLLGGGGWEDQLNRIPTLSNYKPDGSYFFQPTNTNQVARLNQQKNWRDQQTSSLDAKFSLELIKGLKASIFGSMQRDSYIDNFYADLASETSVENPVTPAGGTVAAPGASASKSTTLSKNYAVEPTIEYSARIKTDHSIVALAGYSYQYNVSENFNASNSGFANDVLENNNLNVGNQLAAGRAGIGSGKSDNTLIAFFGRVNYSFSDKYLVSLILRHEGSSRFGANNKWGNFPAASVGWNILKENFMSGSKLFDNLKLRAGYGVTGNQGIPNYMSLVTLSGGGNYTYPDGASRQTYGPSRNPNPDIKWEKKAEINIGLDFSLLKNRIGGAIDVYRRRTSDLLENYSTQLPAFIQSQIFTNVGTIENRGIELTLNASPVVGKKFNWSMDLTASTQGNKMISFSNDVYKATFKEYGDIGGFGALGPSIRTVEGGKLGNFYGKRFAGFDANGKWLFYKADGKTQVLATQIDPSVDRQVIGNGIPKYYLSWTNDFSYNNFDLRIFFRGRFGNQILNTMDIAYGNQTALSGNNVLNSAFGKNAQLQDTYQYSDYYLEPGGFLKLDNLTLGYRIKLNTTYIRNFRVYASAVNLLTITKYKGNDPDFVNDTGLGAGVDSRGPYPSTRQFTVGLNAGF